MSWSAEQLAAPCECLHAWLSPPHPLLQEDKEEDMFFTAQANTLMQKYSAGGKGNGTMVEKGGDSIMDLGTLVIVDDQDEDNMDTMKSMQQGVAGEGEEGRGRSRERKEGGRERGVDEKSPAYLSHQEWTPVLWRRRGSRTTGLGSCSTLTRRMSNR